MPLEIDLFGILVDFGSQNGPKLAPKSIKNLCQDALHFRGHFQVDFWWIFNDFSPHLRTPKANETIAG